jgi:glycosyltransferase involved in cell wall biosynthesis
LSANNNALVDARMLRQVEAANQFGYEATAVGTAFWGGDEEHEVPGGRVIVKRLPRRLEGRGVTARLRAVKEALLPFSLTASPNTVRALAAFLARDAAHGGGPAPARAARKLHSRAIAAVAKARLTVRRPKAGVEVYAEAARWERARARRLFFYRLFPWAARWRVVAPDRIEEELAVGPLLDQLRPDIIHVHDVYMTDVAARAQSRAAAQGRRIALVYDAREFVPGLAYTNPRLVAAHARLEREYIKRFDRVITVSEPLADLLRRHYKLPRRPELVMNVPVLAPRRPETPDIRTAAGVAEGVPLLVYGGGVHPGRGVQTAIQALPLLPDAHLAVVVRTVAWMPAELIELAKREGVQDRLHVVPFVDHDQVVHYFRSADIGLSPLLAAVNHEVALTNKFFEYLFAGLPIVTSLGAQADLVRRLDLGASHRPDDPADLARAVGEVMLRLAELKERIQNDHELLAKFSWEAQLPVLERVYREVSQP